MRFEERLKEVSHIWEEAGKSTCKGPEAGAFLAYLEISEDPSVARGEQSRSEEKGEEEGWSYPAGGEKDFGWYSSEMASFWRSGKV